jgi:hypothetical protein
MNRVIAFFCADEPLAFKACLPEQSLAAPDPDVFSLLPHPERASATIAVADTVVPKALPMLLKLTDPTFLVVARSAGNVCGGSGRNPPGR